MECIQAIARCRKEIFKEQCAENLKRAEVSSRQCQSEECDFRRRKIQYRIVEKGAGAEIESHFLHKSDIQANISTDQFLVPLKRKNDFLDEVIPGLKAV